MEILYAKPGARRGPEMVLSDCCDRCARRDGLTPQVLVNIARSEYCAAGGRIVGLKIC